MNNNQKPRQREKRVAQGGKGVEKRGEGLGTGRLGNGKTPGAGPQNQGMNQGRATGSSSGSGGGSKLGLIVIVLMMLLGGGKLFGGDETGSVVTGTTTQNTTQTTTQSTTQTTTQSTTQTTTQSSGMQMSDLISMLTGSGSVYDYSGTASAVSTASTAASTAKVDETVADGAREKYTTIRGGGKDTMTILVYMCGTDLESQNGMGTSDLKEMANATISDKVNLIVYTGGCSRWRNNVVSSSKNQIYQIKDGGLKLLEDDMGSASMTKPSTLSAFIRYGQENFSANRMCLILWDHGGGSLSGYGYDEKNKNSGSMSLAGINEALEDGGVKFDFIGFDACLMATVENGLMLSRHADYMIASEETEPGVGWYYTNWLTKVSANTSMKTVQIGKLIADDFVSVCNQQCRGQGTTLSVVDLAELEKTVPDELKGFGQEIYGLIRKSEYKTVATARSRTREFAQSSRIDQVDMVNFAENLGTDGAKELSEAIAGCVKYNRTGGGMTGANGLSIYFPYKKASKVNQAVSTLNAIGMDSEYMRCIQEFASLEISGQVAGGTSVSSYGSQSTAMPGLFDALMGTSSSSSGSMEEMLSALFGGGNSSLSFVSSGRSLEETVEYITENHFETENLVWIDGKMELTDAQWSMLESIQLCAMYDDGNGYIDLGMDNVYETDGNALVAKFDGTWISIDGQPCAYYYLGTEEGENGAYKITGYVPCMLDGEKCRLILCFDEQEPYGYIAGAEYEYEDTEVQAKNLIAVGEGSTVQCLCDYYSYDGTYQDSYKLGEEFVLGNTVEIANTRIGDAQAMYCLTDLYQMSYWTPVF